MSRAEMAAMEITINGAPAIVSEGLTVAEIVAQHFEGHSGIAVAVDGEIAPRSEWGGWHLHAGARVEVLTAVQGG